MIEMLRAERFGSKDLNKNKPVESSMFIFTKDTTSICDSGATIALHFVKFVCHYFPVSDLITFFLGE